MTPCAEPVRPGLFVLLFFLFLWLAVPSAPRTHRVIRPLSAFQKIDQYPASLSGLTGPMVANHSCFSSWQGRMRRRTIEPAVIVRTRYYLRTSNLLLFLSGTLSLPYYTLVTFLRRIAGPRPRLCSRGGSLFVMGGEAATSFTGYEPTYPSGSPLPFITNCNLILYRPLLNAHSGSSSTSGPSSYSVGSVATKMTSL